jgi:hypothetical protein
MLRKCTVGINKLPAYFHAWDNYNMALIEYDDRTLDFVSPRNITFDAPPTADNVEGNLQTATNTAMLQLLSDIKELFDKVGYIMMTKDSEMYRRIDAVLAQQQHG